jgi:hypothetical protein
MHRLLTSALTLMVLAGPLAAQVGHAPNSSPYRDIPYGRSLSLVVGDVGGNGGSIGVGPHNGQSYGVRFDIRVGAPVQLGVTVARADLERLVVSASDSVANRVDGPVKQGVTMVELALQINLTGKKSWNRLAPFLGGSAGYMDAAGLPASVKDSSGYRTGGKLYFAPAVGLRIYLSKSLNLRLEGRQLYWKLKYPIAYNLDPAAQPSGDPTTHVNSVLPGNKREEWSGARELRAGLSYSF